MILFFCFVARPKKISPTFRPPPPSTPPHQREQPEMNALKALGQRLADEVMRGVQKNDTLLHVTIRCAQQDRLDQYLRVMDYLLQRGASRIQLNRAHQTPLSL